MLGLLCWGSREFRKKFCRKRPALLKSGQCHFHQVNAPVYNSILVTDYSTKMCMKTVPHPLYRPNLASGDFWLFPKLRDYRYETIEAMKETVTKVFDKFTHEDFNGALPKLLERYKCIAAGGGYFERHLSFMCVHLIKVPVRKKSGNIFKYPRVYHLQLNQTSLTFLHIVKWKNSSILNHSI